MTDKEDRIIGIKVLPEDPKKRYPMWDIGELQADIKRAKANIKLFKDQIEEQRKLINSRQEMIETCKERDMAIEEYNSR
jgi:hypothetical protein